MIKKKILIMITATVVLIMSACGKKASVSTGENSTGVISMSEISPVTQESSPSSVPIPKKNPVIVAPDLAQAKSFSMMAYISISSAPGSTITGKVGLKPGVRSLIVLNPQGEVFGGGRDIYAGDDTGERQTYITTARQDLIAAYRDAAGRIPDQDKIEIYAGDLGGKVLTAGIYHWSNGVKIPSDITLEGDESSVWIFQIKGNFEMAPNVRINLSAGALAKNIYWQISGRVILEENSYSVGNFMNQLTFTAKSNAQVLGRILCKNGKIILSQNVIKLPDFENELP